MTRNKLVRLRPLAAVAVVSVIGFGGLAPSGTQAVAGVPTFANYQNSSFDGGEPSIGSNWKSGNLMYSSYGSSNPYALRVSFDASGAPTWTQVDRPLSLGRMLAQPYVPTDTSVISLDNILFTDHTTGRSIMSELAGNCSMTAITDDDGATWTNQPIGCGGASGVDHQTVGMGSFALPAANPVYPNAVYECAQSVAAQHCALSLNGGLSYGPSAVVATANNCFGLFGHVKVGSDGAVYVPEKNCTQDPTQVPLSDYLLYGVSYSQGVSVSENNGITWDVRLIPDSTSDLHHDASVATGSAGSIYVGYRGADGQAYAAASSDHGRNWAPSSNLSAGSGLANTEFATAVAGDDSRAAVAFLGTTTGGNSAACDFAGTWYLYVATTYDHGATWSTVNVTPNDPVQRGGIAPGGGSTCSNVDNRNLLDFLDATVTKAGRIVVAYPDGCTDACDAPGGAPNYRSRASIARQTGGPGLFAAYDVSGFTGP